MIISSIVLENIRSYSYVEFDFNEGITFLRGDIGSGKSTVLQAIEFAFFGFKKGDLDGNQLLRRGSNKGSVLLRLKKGDEIIEVFREIKRSKTGVGQGDGYIKRAEGLVELSPVELNAHMFEILHFPKSFLRKDRHLLYRFCIYTPQEELKSIIYSPVDKRLEIIRKLFSIDKYKQLINGIDVYSKELKDDRLVLQTRIEDKPRIEEEISKKKEEKKGYDDKIDEINKILAPLEEEKKSLEKKISDIEKNKKYYEDLRLKIDGALGKIETLKDRLEGIEEDIKNIDEFFEKNPDKSKIEEEKKSLNEKKLELENKTREFLKEINNLQERQKKIYDMNLKVEERKNIKKELDELGDVKNKFESLKSKIEERKNKVNEYEKGIKDFESVKERREKINSNLIFLKERIKSIEDENSNIENLEECPRCLQKVSDEHKKKIYDKNSNEREKILKEINLEENNKKDIEKTIKDYEEKREFIGNIKEELAGLEEQRKKVEEEIKKYDSLCSRLEDVDEKLKNFESDESQESLNKKLDSYYKQRDEINEEIRELKNKIEKKNELIEEFNKKLEKKEEYVGKKKSIYEKIEKEGEYKNKRNKVSDKLSELESKFREKKNRFEEIKPKYDEYREEFTKYKTNRDNVEKQLSELKESLDKLSIEEKKLERIKYNENFLKNEVLMIANSIEKKLFTQFYVIAQGEFERIFRELIEDNDLEVRLDIDFSIIVEQNGHEIDIKHLSGGEKSSLAVAYKLALKKTIESFFPQQHYLDVLLLDEPTDGFSAEQIQRLGELLKGLCVSQIIMVSHDEAIESIAEHLISVEKRHHNSFIENSYK